MKKGVNIGGVNDVKCGW